MADTNSLTHDNHASHVQFIEGAQIQALPAPIFKRALAYCCDIGMVSVLLYGLYFALIFIFAIGFGVFAATGLFESLKVWAETSLESGNLGQMILLFILGFLFLLLIYAVLIGPFHAYFIYYEYKQQSTPGKRVFGLRVIALDRPNLSMKDVILREMMRHFEASLILPGLISMLATKKSQRLGDLMTGTMVVHTPKDERKSDYLYLDEDSFRSLNDQLTPTQVLEPVHCKAFLKQVFPVFVSKLADESQALETLARAESIYTQYYQANQTLDLTGIAAKENFLRFHAQRCFDYVNKL
ncbi:MAG TPA: RDD family protein [Oligoflexia bacterium]|nr:RDD family protein [Oligoflexia bacterium]HMR24341.1 RDD family protein [Oligoflexia bacterium]